MRFRKTQDEAMDAYLDSVGLWRKPIPKDGSCLFRAVAEQLFQTQVFHEQVRQACVQYLSEHRADFSSFIEVPFDDYLSQLQDPTVWAGQVEISALSCLYRRDFVIYQTVGKLPVSATQNGFHDKIVLCFTDGNHYDSVYPKTFGQSIALCQSIVYETLYRGVFKLDSELEEAVRFIREQSKSRRYRKDTSPNWRIERPDYSSSHEGDPTTTQPVPTDVNPCNHNNRFYEEFSRPIEAKSSPPVPFRIAKALDPEIYRNVELDIWLEAKKEQQQRDLELGYDLHFTPGDKCQVTLGGGEDEKLYHAHIQEIGSQDKGPVVVFIEELGQKLDVPISSLRPIAQYSTSSRSETYSRKKSKRSKGVAILVSQRQGYMSPPPGDTVGRGRSWNGIRSPSPHYPGGPIHKPRQLVESSGHPVRHKWHPDSYYIRPNVRPSTQPAFWKPHPPGLWRPRFPSHQGYICNRSEDGLMMGSPPPGDLPPDVTAQTIPEDHRLVNGMEQLCVNGQPMEMEKKGAMLPPTSQPHSVVSQQVYSHPPPLSQPQLIPQQPPPPAQMNGQQVLMPVYPCIPVSYAEVAAGQVNPNCGLSQDPSGADLPLSDFPTIRFFYNLGQNYYRWYTCIVNYNQMNNGRVEPMTPLGKNCKGDEKFVNWRSHTANKSQVQANGPQCHTNIKKLQNTETESDNNSPSAIVDVDKRVVDSCRNSDSGFDSESSSVSDSSHENVTNISLQSDSSNAGGGADKDDLGESVEASDKTESDGLESENCPNGYSSTQPKSQRKYFTWGPYKLLKPIKDIPPRFQQLLAECNAEKARCEGIPIVYQCDPSLGYPPCYPPVWNSVSKSEFPLNPSAPDFTPSQSYCEEQSSEDSASTESQLSSGHSSSSGSTNGDIVTPVNPVSQLIPPPDHACSAVSHSHPQSHHTLHNTAHPHYAPQLHHASTVHPACHYPPSSLPVISYPPPPIPINEGFAPHAGFPSSIHYASTNASFSHLDSNRSCFYHTLQSSPTGYGNGCPSTAATCTPNSSGIVYFTPQSFPTQPMMSGYNCSLSYPAQPGPMTGPPQQAHCMPQYTVYGQPQ